MTDTEVASATAPAATTPKKAAKGKGSKTGTAASKKPKAKPTHPKTADMVNAAIKELKEKGGSSLQAIKKYISANYKVDAEKMAPFIRKYLKSAVTSGSLVQTKGKGASGSFKMSASVEKSAPKKKSPKPAATKSGELKAKKAKAATSKKAVAKKSASSTPKKTVAKEKKPKSPAAPKAKKTKPAPTKKPKAPKPKKVSAAKPKSPGKKVAAAPKKK